MFNEVSLHKQTEYLINFLSHTHTIVAYITIGLLLAKWSRGAIPESDCCRLLNRAFLSAAIFFARAHMETFVAPFFHFPSIFITARLFPVSGILTFPTVLLTAVTFTPLTGAALFPSSFRVLFRRLAYYGQASEFKVAFTKRLFQLFTLVFNYSVCDQRLRTSSFLPPSFCPPPSCWREIYRLSLVVTQSV